MNDIRYVNSDMEEICFTESPFYMLRDTDLFNYDWDYVTTGYDYPKIVKFTQKMKQRKLTIYVTGKTEAEYLENLETLLAIVDHDLYYKVKGRLYVGDYYLEGYFIKSEKTDKYLTSTRSGVTLTYLVEDAMWRTDSINELSSSDVPNISGRFLNDRDVAEGEVIRFNVRGFNYIKFTYCNNKIGGGELNLVKDGQVIRTITISNTIVNMYSRGAITSLDGADYIEYTARDVNFQTAFELLTFMPDYTLGYDYSYDYEYDLEIDVKTIIVPNQSYGTSDWNLSIEGPANNIRLYINDMVIGFNVDVYSGETLMINSTDKTAYIYNTTSGNFTNVFNDRLKSEDVFGQIDSGDLVVSWKGFKRGTLNIAKNRSEPKWT